MNYKLKISSNKGLTMNQKLEQRLLKPIEKYWIPDNLILKFTEHFTKRVKLHSSIYDITTRQSLGL